ncbi:MAG: hypothetical protein MJY79_00525 [Bacteroidaceae bacterium]|nr:hypothetical protein [Bacteroidaceae bacterium]
MRTYPINGQQQSSVRMLSDYAMFTSNIVAFNRNNPQEKVYLQFDNTSYYQGETIWFKAYVVTASTLQRATSGVLYVELLSAKGDILQTQKLKIVAGQADGAFMLTDNSTAQAREMRGVLSYPSGFYEVRAYTMNMLNFGPETAFSRVFPVFEKPSAEGGFITEPPVVRTPDFRNTAKRIEPSGKETSVTFYPEGGHLLMGVRNRVAFKVTGPDGFGKDATLVYNNSEFRTIHAGMGYFDFVPTDVQDEVSVLCNGKEQRIELPVAEQEGCALCLTDYTSGKEMDIRLTCSASLDQKDVGMTLTCRGAVTYFGTCTLSSKGVNIRIPTGNVPEGVCQLTVFDHNGAILCSRSVYNHAGVSVPSLNVMTDRRMAPFSRINLDFELTDANGNPFRDRFCLSVRDIRAEETSYKDDLRTFLLLSSDLKGFIESPGYYFENTDAEHVSALNLLTMIQGWERYDWQTMAGMKPYQELHRMEKGLTLNGWVLNPSGKKPEEDAHVYAALIPEDKSKTERFEYVTGADGYFGFDLSDFEGSAKLTLETITDNDRITGTNARFRLERSMVPEARVNGREEIQFSSRTSVEMDVDDIVPGLTVNNGSNVILQPESVLDEVVIEGSRKYIDYFRFTSLDVNKDVELTLDRGEFSTSIRDYLMESGYDFWHETGEVIKNSGGKWEPYAHDSDWIPDTVRTDAQKVLWMAKVSRLGNNRIFWYVHDKNSCLYSGIYAPSWLIDTKDVSSICIYDKPVSFGSATSLSPLLMEATTEKQDIDGMAALKGNELDEGHPWMFQFSFTLIDVLLKDKKDQSTQEELSDLSRRATTVSGYSKSPEFYSPQYPEGPIAGDTDYRRTLYWNPNVITGTDGRVRVSFFNNSYSEHLKVSGCGMTADGTPYVMDYSF